MRRQFQGWERVAVLPVRLEAGLHLGERFARRLEFGKPFVKAMRVVDLVLPVVGQNVEHVVSDHIHVDLFGGGHFDRAAADEGRHQPIDAGGQPFQHVAHAQAFAAGVPERRA